MSPCKLENIKITSLESDEYDPIVTVGSGNTASVFTTDYCVDPFDDVEIALNTSALDNEEISIDTTGCITDFDFAVAEDKAYEENA